MTFDAGARIMTLYNISTLNNPAHLAVGCLAVARGRLTTAHAGVRLARQAKSQ